MSWIIPVLKAIGIGTATNVLSSKILGTDKQKAQIGAGTAPSLESGVPIDIAPVQGTEVQDFGAATEGFADPEIDRSAEEQQLMEDLIAAGINPEELGIVGLAFGGYLNRFGGGAIPTSNGIADLINIPELGIDPTLLEIEPPVAPDASTTMEKIEMWYNSLDPETQKALMAGGEQLGGSALTRLVSGKQPGRSVTIANTQTLPGNSSRRRAAQMNIKPIQGSVRNAADGGVLDRQMFQPSRETYMGGPMNGPGGPKDDLIPVMASNGEYMLSKAAVDAAGDGSHAMGIARLDAFNERGNKRYG